MSQSLPISDMHPDLLAVLDILGACILTDRYERDEELVELSNSVQILARHISPENVMARRDVSTWFNDNRERLKSTIGDEAATRALMARITDPELRRKTLTAIFAVCVCDYHLADEESAFIRLALDTWAPEKLTADQLTVLD